MVLISKTDSIPTKKIVSVLGNIAIKKTYSESEASAMKALSNKAKMAGANAIVNFFFRGKGFSCTGLAVIVEDIEPVKQEMTKLCLTSPPLLLNKK